MAKAKPAGRKTQKIAESIAERLGGYTTPLNYKTESSIMRKMRNEGLRIDQIKDLARTTIIVPDGQIEAARKMLQDAGATRVKIQDAKTFDGYTGTIANFRINGQTTEIQVNTERMIYAKNNMRSGVKILGAKRYRELYRETGQIGGWGHSYYEGVRGDNPNKRRKGQTDVINMRNYYSLFR